MSDKLDVVMAGIAENGTAAEFDRQIPPKRQAFLRNFVEAQMVSYEAKDEGVSKGWFYWTLKMEGGAFAEWVSTRTCTSCIALMNAYTLLNLTSHYECSHFQKQY